MFAKTKGGSGVVVRGWVVLHSHACNHSSVLMEDKKKYSLLNKSSLEQQKEPTIRKRKEFAWDGWVWGMRAMEQGNPVFPLRTRRLSNLAKA